MHIRKAILHILDKDSGNLLLSQSEMTLDSPLIAEYINKLCIKIGKGNIKSGFLDDDAMLANVLLDDRQDFIAKTSFLSTKIFEIISPAEEIPAADYLFFEGVDDYESVWFGIIRLDYSSQFTHFLEASDGILNQLVMHHAILPSVTQTPSEAFIVNLTTGEYQLSEKQYVMEGKRTPYFSKMVLEIEAEPTTSSQIKDIKKAIVDTAKQFDEVPYEVLAATQQVIHKQLEDDSSINADTIAHVIFENNIGAQTALRDELIKKDVPNTVKVTNVVKYEKKYAKQKFKLANGIEITVPVEVYGNQDIIEFVNNPDGTISVMIKNVESITNTFNG